VASREGADEIGAIRDAAKLCGLQHSQEMEWWCDVPFHAHLRVRALDIRHRHRPSRAGATLPHAARDFFATAMPCVPIGSAARTDRSVRRTMPTPIVGAQPGKITMRDGRYRVRVTSCCFDATSASTVHGGVMYGTGEPTRVVGQLFQKASHAVGAFRIELATVVATAAHLPATFAMETTGPADDTSFSLLGTGPLGPSSK
jgi:hypothetical protein